MRAEPPKLETESEGLTELYSHLSRKTSIITVLSLTVPVFLGLTNPSKEEYLEYAIWKFKNTTCRQAVLASPVQLPCVSLSTLPLSLSTQFLSGYVYRENYVFFSIYTIDAFGLSDHSIGVGKQLL